MSGRCNCKCGPFGAFRHLPSAQRRQESFVSSPRFLRDGFDVNSLVVMRTSVDPLGAVVPGGGFAQAMHQIHDMYELVHSLKSKQSHAPSLTTNVTFLGLHVYLCSTGCFQQLLAKAFLKIHGSSSSYVERSLCA